MEETCLGSLTGATFRSAFAPPASIWMDGFLSTFLYHCVSEPVTGKRYSVLPSNTNQTGMEIERPDVLPVTVMLISRERERRSLRASFGTSLLLMLTSSASPSTSLVRRALGRNSTPNKIFKSQGISIPWAKL